MYRLIDFFNEILYVGKSTKDNFKSVFRGWLLHILFALFSVIFIIIVDRGILPWLGEPSIYATHYKIDDLLKEIGLFYGVILITILMPIFEELAFRLFLKPSGFTIAISVALLLFYFTGDVYYIDGISYYLRILACLIVFLIIRRFDKKVVEIYSSVRPSGWIIVSSVIFSLSHLGNFDPINYPVWYLYPIYVLPQFFMGLIASTIRINNGLIWSVLLHILINGSVVWPKLITQD
ncbi:CPBP family glutamic-type intramembrane protease [Larkinella sp. C7]|jgi:membrane protease YdiL (CAAX protease family)|uniref:CPBP family glutamic-type intramembrane protease n=1 Tax=Larkinella sp. C7 TaxID=2576607 RepID=UPI0011114F93|nr:CPBP family glutamic-type intramembrane protease [Larkinella sp. C7]